MTMMRDEDDAGRLWAGADPDGPGARRPVLVTRFSLSRRTAIGVQTRQFIDALPGARHLHWEEVQSGLADPRSTLLENRLAARLGMLKRAGLVSALAHILKLKRWRDDRPGQADATRIRQMGQTASVVYLAPIGGADARRMRAIAGLLDRPFIVHLWDMLDGPPEQGSDLAWLIANAEATYCLTEPMNQAIGQPGAPLLLFTRAPTRHSALPPAKGEMLRIALVGDIASYRAGLSDLIEADRILHDAGHPVEWIHVGAAGILRGIPEGLKARLRPTGFIEADDDRDAMLASCHLAFMAGPKASPEADHRSRFSIPSRLLDFCAIGIPVVGVVYPRSATAGFAPEIAGTMCRPDGKSLASAILALAGVGAWQAGAAAARDVFRRVQADDPIGILRCALGEA